MTIETPEAFIDVCRAFYQDVVEDYPTLDALAAYAVDDLGAPERLVVSRFIDELLGGSFTDIEIKAIFNNSPSEVYLTDSKQVVELLEHMRSRLRSPQQADPE